jgi:hypothetical protein
MWAIGGRGASRKPVDRWEMLGTGTILKKSMLTKFLWAIGIRRKPVNIVCKLGRETKMGNN